MREYTRESSKDISKRKKAKNQPLILIEAMKMETIIVSKVEGIIDDIKVSQDEMVGDRQLLIMMKEYKKHSSCL